MINFIKGIIIGFAMAAPVGPLALLCIRQSLTKGLKAGAITAYGIALGDGFYALIAALGLSAFSSFVLAHREYLFVAGGIILIVLGIKGLIAPLPPQEKTIEIPIKARGLTILLQTMIITLTNPMTILSFVAAFSAFEFERFYDTNEAIYVALGITLGSFFWFLLISATFAYFRTKVTPAIYRIINLISGSLLIVYGTLFLLDAAWAVLFKTYLSSKIL